MVVRPDIVFAEHDGAKLLGDLYLPKGLGKAPVLVGVHGGGWQLGDRKFYTHWGNYLRQKRLCRLAIEYRLMKPGAKTWPGAVYDTKAAVQFVRAEAAEFGLDADRVGLIGDSAGRAPSALVAFAGKEPLFSSEYRGDRHAAVPAEVKAVVGFYGVYDHAGAMGARPDHAAARPDHREIPRRPANGQPQESISRRRRSATSQ